MWSKNIVVDGEEYKVEMKQYFNIDDTYLVRISQKAKIFGIFPVWSDYDCFTWRRVCIDFNPIDIAIDNIKSRKWKEKNKISFEKKLDEWFS